MQLMTTSSEHVPRAGVRRTSTLHHKTVTPSNRPTVTSKVTFPAVCPRAFYGNFVG
jgi:hypothetical protein